MLAEYLEERYELDQPINIHVTGCHHSCAQHAIGDIGLIATKVEVGEEMVEGYHILVGGRTGLDPKIGVKLFESIPFEQVPEKISSIIENYLEGRLPNQTFEDYSRNQNWSGSLTSLSMNPSVA